MKTTLRTLSLVLVGVVGMCYSGCGGGGGGGEGGGAPAGSAPTIVSADAIQYAAGTINFTATVIDIGALYFEYGIGAFTDSTPTLVGPTFLYQVTGLTEGATYQYRAVTGTIIGATQSVVVNTTSVPVCTTGTATPNGVFVGAIVNAYVNPEGSTTIYRFGYYYANKSTGVWTSYLCTSYTTLPFPTNTWYDAYAVSTVISDPYTVGPTGAYDLWYQVVATNSKGSSTGVLLKY
jgi:hypothetical protein